MTPADLLPALPWAVPFLSLFRLARHDPDLIRSPTASGRLVSVIVPARNEAETITTIVRSILATSYDPIELLVVDDRSTDETAAIVEALARDDARLRLVRGAELPAEWFGKPWACVQGHREARGDILLFTDADTRHAPGLLAHAVGALQTEGTDLLTVSPHQETLTVWERLVMPQIWLMLGIRYHPRVVNRARRARDVIANGQFIMVTREAYEAVGTHEIVRREVAEDLALAQTFFSRGRKVWFAFADSLMATRMYRSLPHLIEGWSKNIYLGGRRSFPDEPLLRALVPLMLTGAMLFWLLPPIVTGLALAAWLDPGLTAGAATGVALSALFWIMISAGMRIPPWYGLLYPLGAAMVLYIVLRSTWRGGQRVEWRGRTYAVGGGS